MIPKNDVKNEAALLIADGDQRNNTAHAFALTLKCREELKKRTDDTTIEKLQVQLLLARSLLCAKMVGRRYEADILHVVVRHLFYTQDIPFRFPRQSRDTAAAKDHAKGVRMKKNSFLKK